MNDLVLSILTAEVAVQRLINRINMMMLMCGQGDDELMTRLLIYGEALNDMLGVAKTAQDVLSVLNTTGEIEKQIILEFPEFVQNVGNANLYARVMKSLKFKSATELFEPANEEIVNNKAQELFTSQEKAVHELNNVLDNLNDKLQNSTNPIKDMLEEIKKQNPNAQIYYREFEKPKGANLSDIVGDVLKEIKMEFPEKQKPIEETRNTDSSSFDGWQNL